MKKTVDIMNNENGILERALKSLLFAVKTYKHTPANKAKKNKKPVTKNTSAPDTLRINCLNIYFN